MCANNVHTEHGELSSEQPVTIVDVSVRVLKGTHRIHRTAAAMTWPAIEPVLAEAFCTRRTPHARASHGASLAAVCRSAIQFQVSSFQSLSLSLSVC